MANEEMGLEPVLVETEAPSRADGRGKFTARVAKLTSRTISSLRTKIKEKRLASAYKKYNKKYRDMRIALKEANALRAAYENGESVTQSQVVEAFDIVATYDRKLSKYAVKLLRDDIKRAVADKKPKPIRVPRILLGKLRPLAKALIKAAEKRKTKKLQKSLEREMKGATRDYIETSLEGALFKNANTGELRDHVDAGVIQGLATDRTAATFEERIANLRRFISADGKTSVFGEESIGTADKPGTNLPPAEPTASVERTTPPVDMEALTRGLGGKSTTSTPAQATTGDEPKNPAAVEPVTESTLTSGLGTNSATSGVETETVPETPIVPEDAEINLSEEDQRIIASRKREVESIISLNATIDSLSSQLETVADPATKASIESMIATLNSEMRGIIERSIRTKTKTSEVEEVVVTSEQQPAVAAPVEEATESLEPVEVVPEAKQDVPTPVAKENVPAVTITNPDLGRVAQSGTPSTLVVTPHDLAEMQRRNDAAKAKIATLTTEIENLREQKALYQQYIEVANATRDNERTVSELSATRDAEATEVASLATDAAAITEEVGSRYVQRK